jgi:hypothetical protein
MPLSKLLPSLYLCALVWVSLFGRLAGPSLVALQPGCCGKTGESRIWAIGELMPVVELAGVTKAYENKVAVTT